MYYTDNEKKKPYVITYTELFFTFLVFTAVLIVLYPKDMLKEQILAESSNYDLSMLYLKNLLAHSPEDETLMIVLAKQSLRSGKKDLSLRLLQLLIQSQNDTTRKEATLLSYELEKENFFYYQGIGERENKNKTLDKLENLFQTIYIQKMFKDIDYWYKEAIFLNNKEAIHLLLSKKIENEPSNMSLLKEKYYLEKSLKHLSHTLQTLKRLRRLDTENKEKWILAEYYTYIEMNRDLEAEKLLKMHVKSSPFFTKKLVEFYFTHKKYVEASRIYMQLFKNENSYNKKREYFFKAISILQMSSDINKAAELANKYENYYLSDRDARIKILKLYMAVGRLDLAQELSIKIIDRGFK